MTAARGDSRPRGHTHRHGPRGADGHGAHRHDHSHGGVDPAILRSREAIRTLWLSLAVLGVTAAFQLVIVVLSGSVALLADTVHNMGDALTAVPLAIAFALLRRPPTKRLSYGWGRAEDFAGLAVVVIILFSAVYAAYESVARLIEPAAPSHLLATAIAGAVGFIGNEWVAVYRIRSGKRIGSAALVADGYHARVDGFTSLAVVLGVAGVAAGFELADPIVGIAISLVIVRIVWQSLRTIGLRAMDGVEAGTIDTITRSARGIEGVRDVTDVRARWLGHGIRAELTIGVSPQATVTEACELADRVRHEVSHELQHITDVTVEAQPARERPGTAPNRAGAGAAAHG
jgi:cation diffusion facilitator family transporter